MNKLLSTLLIICFSVVFANALATTRYFNDTLMAGCTGQIAVAGESATYIMTNTPGQVSIGGNALRIKYNSRSYYTSRCAANYDPTIFKRFFVLDKTLSLTVDVSSIGCGCNAAFYFVLMPAYGSNQQPDQTTCHDYYCDANKVCGVWCPEIDLIECNNRALQVSPHKCNAPNGKYYSDCDRSGCGINTKSRSLAYGYGNQFQINTQQPYNIAFHFQTSGGQLSQITTTLSQNGKNVVLTHNAQTCGGSYLPALTDAFKQGLTIVTSYWGGAGGEMSWLDVPPCGAGENCATGGTAVFSNLSIR